MLTVAELVLRWTKPEIGWARREEPVLSWSMDFLLRLAERFFPTAGLGRGDVLASFAGARPLVDSGSSSLSRLSREHKIVTSSSGLISVGGGKFTTFRRMAEAIVDRVTERLEEDGRLFGPCRTGELELNGVLPPTPSPIPSPNETRQCN